MEPKHRPPAQALSLGLRLSVEGLCSLTRLSYSVLPQHLSVHTSQGKLRCQLASQNLAWGPGPCPGHISAAAARETRAKEGRSLTKLMQQRADLDNQGLALLLQYIPLLQAQFKCPLFQEAFPATPAQRKGSLLLLALLCLQAWCVW